MNAQKKGGSGAGKAVSLGVGALALSAAAYYFFGPKGKQRRAKASVWAAKLKKGVVAELGNMKEVSQEAYNKVVDRAAELYKNEKKVSQVELQALVKELKSHWKNIKDAAKEDIAKKKTIPKKVAKKKVTKKVAKKAGK